MLPMRNSTKKQIKKIMNNDLVLTSKYKFDKLTFAFEIMQFGEVSKWS